MDWHRIEGNWRQLKGKIKARWGELTDDDLAVIAGQREELAGGVQQRYGLANANANAKAKAEAEEQVSDWERRYEDRFFLEERLDRPHH